MTNPDMPWLARTPPRRHSAGRRVTEERLERILDVAIDICLEDGFAAVTMQSVARRADYARPLVYDCYGTPENIVLALLDREAATLRPSVASAGRLLDGQFARSRDHLARILIALLAQARPELKPWALFGVSTDGAPVAVAHRVTRVRETIRGLLVVALRQDTAGVAPPPDIEAMSYLTHGIVDAFIRRMLEDPDANSPVRVERFVASLAGIVRLAAPPEPPGHG